MQGEPLDYRAKQLSLIVKAYHGKACPSNKKICEYMGIKPSALSRIIGRLQEFGYLEVGYEDSCRLFIMDGYKTGPSKSAIGRREPGRARRVYDYLIHAAMGDDPCPSDNEMAADLDMPVDAIRTSLGKLEAEGKIRRERVGLRRKIHIGGSSTGVSLPGCKRPERKHGYHEKCVRCGAKYKTTSQFTRWCDPCRAQITRDDTPFLS